MDTPFNFPMHLLTGQEVVEAAKEKGVEFPDQERPELPMALTVLESRASTSRRGGHKVTFGFQMDADDPTLIIPVTQVRLELN